LQNSTSDTGGSSSTPAFRLYAQLVMASTIFLIFVGALVTTKGAGLAVPDWPLSFGTINPRMVGGVFYEHGHRMVASAVGFLTLVLAFWGQFGGTTSSVVRRLSWFALALVIVQGLLGGLTVLLKLPRPVSIAHGCVAQLFLCTLVAVVLYTLPSFVRTGVGLVGDRASALRLAGVMAVIAVLTQLLIAATMRHMGAGLVIGDFPLSLGYLVPPFTSNEVIINYAHRVMALVVLLMLSLFAWRIHRERAALPRAARVLSWLMIGLVCWQVTLGALTVWTARALIPTSWHVVNGAMVLATTFATCMWVLRSTAHYATESSPGEVAVEEQRSAPPAAFAMKDWMDLFKVKLVGMSVITAALAFWAGRAGFDFWGLFHVCLGVGMIGSGAGAFNQLLEVEVDRLMTRTCKRPIVGGRISAGAAEFWGCALSTLGVLYLGLALHPLAGLLSALAVVSYAFVYTPLKRISPYATLIGAVPGALPVLVGWSAATGGLEVQGWVLFFILFLWQLPHFMAIAWLCKEDYARARLPMVTVLDPRGDTAAIQAVAYCLALLPVSLAPSLCGLAGMTYFVFALILGLGYLHAGVRWGQQRTTPMARRLLLTSVVYLPLLFGGMVFW
jgi:heme o synthase